MNETPLRDMLRAKGDPFAEELDRIEDEYVARYGCERRMVAVAARCRADARPAA